LAVVVTIAKGYDLGYIWKTQDHPAERTTGGYYLNAAQAGEPPGRWWGPGAQALGLIPGQTVDRQPYDAVYRQTDPRTKAKLGRPRGRYPTFSDHLARLTAAEPHATAERLIELEREAAQASRQPAAYYDVTISFSKSISVLHASIRENERRARQAGDDHAAAYWAGREQAFQEVLHRANRAALEYLQAWAGITRTGYHGTRVDGREPGRFESAGLIVTSWLQGTSREGDPQDHIHNQIARIVRTYRDGKWRALDTLSVRGVLGALQAVAATSVECELAREFGVDWIPRADGRGNEIRGVTQAQMDAYSTRTVQVRAKERELARAWERKHGRAPTSRELLHIANAATLQSRKGKDAGAIDWDTLTQRWDATLGGELAGIAPSVSDARGPGAQAGEHRGGRAPSGPPAPDAQTRALAKALVLVSDQHPAWTRHDLLKQLALVLPPEARQMSPEEAQELLLGLAEEALSGRTGEVVCLEAPEWPPLPASLRRELDGRSIYTRPGVARYATAAQLSMEERLVAHAQAHGAPRVPAELAARRAHRPGCRRLARARLRPHRRGDHRPGWHRQDPRPRYCRPDLGRPGGRHRHLPERHQRTPAGRHPRRRQHHPAARRPPARPDPARLTHPGRRRLHDLHHSPRRPHRARRPPRLQADPGRGPGAARRGRRRRRHDAPRGPARLRPARRTGPVHRRLGTRRLSPPPLRRRHRAG
jgi:conjugative relaxase-like TrwC/TraI family protein